MLSKQLLVSIVARQRETSAAQPQGLGSRHDGLGDAWAWIVSDTAPVTRSQRACRLISSRGSGIGLPPWDGAQLPFPRLVDAACKVLMASSISGP